MPQFSFSKFRKPQDPKFVKLLSTGKIVRYIGQSTIKNWIVVEIDGQHTDVYAGGGNIQVVN
jgi:hypothetical protein